jgi:hypothetical protein
MDPKARMNPRPTAGMTNSDCRCTHRLMTPASIGNVIHASAMGPRFRGGDDARRDDDHEPRRDAESQCAIDMNHVPIIGPRGRRRGFESGTVPGAGAGAGPYSGWKRYAM